MIRNLRRRTNLNAPGQDHLLLNHHSARKQNWITRDNFKSKRRRSLLVFKILLPLLFVNHFLCPLLFGEHPVHGGYIGMLVDMRIKLHLWNQKLKIAKKEAEALGLHVTSESTTTRIHNVPQCTQLELIRRHKHKETLIKNMMVYRYMNFNESGVGNDPKIVLRQHLGWSRPFPDSLDFVALDLDIDDMDSYMNHQANNNLIQIYQILDEHAKAELFFITFLRNHGGVYISSRCSRDEIHRTLVQSKKLASQPQAGWIHIEDGKLRGLLVPPNHSYLICIMTQFERMPGQNISLYQGIIQEHAFLNSAAFGAERSFVQLSEDCSIDAIHLIDKPHDDRKERILTKDIAVSIQVNDEPKLQYTNKISIDQRLSQKSRFCIGIWMWLCHRCLKSVLHGTYSSCASACDPCTSIMYSEPEIVAEDNIVHVKVDVRGFEVQENVQMIPRIIHQTWREHITPSNYPNLHRITNMWKTSGWSYRFYTDDSSRQYIVDHFPRHFVEAYDAMIPAAYKADLFRYMLLMKDGGIYADVDVLLDASLESFITPTMSFFVPRDAVASYADGEYCLWNGVIGAAPGHPIIIRAVERLVNLILNRADLLDLEREVAEKAGVDTETWKIRAIQELLLSGPCALGIATNEVLGRNPVTRFDVGWLKESNVKDHDIGDILILMVSSIVCVQP